ncbi:MAG: ammonium transporter, partial [Rhodopirellula bahusiensis]
MSSISAFTTQELGGGRTGFRFAWLTMVLLVGMMGIGGSLASVASAQDEPAAATDTAEVADAGDADSEEPAADAGVGY